MLLNTDRALSWIGFFGGFSIINAVIVFMKKLPASLILVPVGVLLFLLIGILPILLMIREEFNFDEVIDGSKRGIASGFGFYLGQVIVETFLN